MRRSSLFLGMWLLVVSTPALAMSAQAPAATEAEKPEAVPVTVRADRSARFRNEVRIDSDDAVVVEYRRFQNGKQIASSSFGPLAENTVSTSMAAVGVFSREKAGGYLLQIDKGFEGVFRVIIGEKAYRLDLPATGDVKTVKVEPSVAPVVVPQELVKASAESPLLVVFGAAWCGHCKNQGPTNSQAVKDTKCGYRYVDVDAEPAIAQAMQVSGFPTMVVLSRGKILKRFVGITPLPDLVNALKNAAK